MLEVQSRIMQYANNLSENVANNDVFGDRQTSQIPVDVRNGHRSQANDENATLSAQKYVLVRSKRCPEVYKIEKFYVGLLRELPPPSEVQDKWENDIRRDLEEHLRQATSMLPKSMADEDTITETVLCMAGKKCSPASVVMASGATCPKDPIVLKPTVWIHCGSKKCKKMVIKAIRNLAYLRHFLERFAMEPSYVSLHAPWPAAGEWSSDASLVGKESPNISFAIQFPFYGCTTLCGAKLKFTIQTSDSIVERYSTFGGLVIIENSLFGLTSAHAIVNCLLESSEKNLHSELESEACSSDSESDIDDETSSDSALETSSESPCSQTQPTSTTHLSTEAHQIPEAEEGIWMDLPLPKVLAYMGRGTTSGDYSFPNLVPDTSDFALIDLGVFRALRNAIQDPIQGITKDISDFIPLSDLLSGEVYIITACCDKPLVGYLLESDTSIILRGTVMRTKKIQIASPGVHGMSGSWVIQDGKLCGSIYAAYKRSPYLHMIPIENIFRDIFELLAFLNIRLATARDIRQHRSVINSSASLPVRHSATRSSPHLIPTAVGSEPSPSAGNDSNGSSGAKEYLWVCCECGGENNFILHASCSFCHNHWRSSCCQSFAFIRM